MRRAVRVVLLLVGLAVVATVSGALSNARAERAPADGPCYWWNGVWICP